MDTTNFIDHLVKVGMVLLIVGKLGYVTFDYAVKAAHEQQFGLISLGKLSRELGLPRHQKSFLKRFNGLKN